LFYQFIQKVKLVHELKSDFLILNRDHEQLKRDSRSTTRNRFQTLSKCSPGLQFKQMRHNLNIFKFERMNWLKQTANYDIVIRYNL